MALRTGSGGDGGRARSRDGKAVRDARRAQAWVDGAERRESEPALMVTRADVLVAVVGLTFAGVVAAHMWFGAGASGGGSTTLGADLSAGADGSAPVDASASQGSAAGSGLYAVVQNTQGFREVLPLSQDATVRVESSLGTNVVEVSDGRVRVSEADCANQVCVQTGWAQYEGQTITCLPHQLVVEVVSDPDDASDLG